MVKACIFLILIFLQAPHVYAAGNDSATDLLVSTTVTDATNAEITNFSINPKYVNMAQPQYIDFWVTVKNIGNLDIIARPYVNITHSGGSIANITFTPQSIGPALEVVFKNGSFYTEGLEVGCYNATVVVSYDGKTTPEVKDSFCIQSTPSPPGGGGGPSPKPIVPPMTPPSIKFAKMPVLVEVRPGTIAMESILIENPSESNVTELAVEVSGIPVGWVNITPSVISLLSGQSEALNAVIAVPLGAWPGDYRVTVILAGRDEIRAENFFILRIKSYPSGYEKPSITRGVDVDRDGSITHVSIRVENSGRFIELIEITESIPKILAPTADSIIPISPEVEIVERDPVLKWGLKDLDPYETRIILYEVSRILEEYSPYVYWPVGQVNIFYTLKKPLAEPIGIEKMSAPTLGPGKAGEISVTLMNFETAPIKMSAIFELPAGWKVEPDRIYDTIPPRTGITFVFTVTPSPDTVLGTYITTFRVFYDSQESSKDGTLFVTQTVWEEILRYPGALLKRSPKLLVIILAILSALFYIRKKRRKRYKREAVSAIRGIRERIGLE